MAWDLGKAMRKKEEFESARLMDFEFRQRARAARLLARKLGLPEGAVAQLTVTCSDTELIEKVSADAERARDVVAAEFQSCLALAYRELVEERGDPTPYRLG